MDSPHRYKEGQTGQKHISDHNLVSVAAPSLELFNRIREAVVVLDSFGIPYEISIVAAHRAPNKTIRYVRELEGKGIEVVLACGTGSAHLPGMIASLTSIPVIGIPLRNDSLGGIDSLLSIIQMPPGVPVATVGIGSACNAALLACQILSLKYPLLKNRILLHKQNMEEKVESEASNLKGS